MYIVKAVAVGIKMAVIEMSTHKLRSVLSMLGVMLGVASLVAMLTFIGGIKVLLNEKMGSWIGSVWYYGKWDPSEEEKLAWSRSPGLRLSDGEFLVKNSSSARSTVEQISRRGSIKIAGEPFFVHLTACNQEGLERTLKFVTISHGRNFSDEEFRLGTRVCMLSLDMAKKMADRLKITLQEIPGRKIQFNDHIFTIAAVLSPQIDQGFGRSMFTPIKAVQKYVTGQDPDPGAVEIRVSDPQKIVEQAMSLSKLLIQRHRGVEDFEYNTAEGLDEFKKMLNNISIVFSTISVLSLLVGGLSIMNVMLSSISERIREIGTRKALGAQGLQIFIQFIAETITLSFIGGCIGIFLGGIPLIFKEAILLATNGAIEPTILPIHLFYTCIVIVSIGIAFGFYPALKAMRMNPIDALRYE